MLERQGRFGQHAGSVNGPSPGFELIAVVTTTDDRRFSAPIANLTRASVFVETGEKLRVLEPVRLALQELELEAEVGLVATNPAGIVLAFRAPEEARERIEGLIARTRVLATGLDEPWSEATVPGDEGDIGLAIAAAQAAEQGKVTDTLAGVAPAAATGEFNALTPNPFASITPTPFASQTPTPFADIAHKGVAAIPVPKPEASESGAPADAAAASVEATLPELAPDGTLRFASASAFQTQFETNLVHGGIVARSTPLPIGSQKVLRFSVPGVSDEVQLSARVGFVGQGTVGFMIDTFAVHRPRLESILQRLS